MPGGIAGPRIARVVVVFGAAVPAGVIRVRDLVVPDDVRTIARDVVSAGQPAHQRRRRTVHCFGVPGASGVRVPLVLDAGRVLVHRPVAGVPGGVAVVHLLRDLAVARTDVEVRARGCRRILEPRDRSGIAALHVMDDDGRDRIAAATCRVVAGRSGHERDAGAVGAVLAGEILLDRAPHGAARPVERLRRQPDEFVVDLYSETVAQHAKHLRGVRIGDPRAVDAGKAHHRHPPVAEAALVEIAELREERFRFAAKQRRAAARVCKRIGAQRFRREPGQLRGASERSGGRSVVAIDQVQQPEPSVGRRRVHAQPRIHVRHRDQDRPRHALQIRRALQLLLQPRRRGRLRARNGEQRGEGRGTHATTVRFTESPRAGQMTDATRT